MSNNIYIHNNKYKCKVTRNTISPSIIDNIHNNDIKQIQHNSRTYLDPVGICNIFIDYFVDLNKDNLT